MLYERHMNIDIFFAVHFNLYVLSPVSVCFHHLVWAGERSWTPGPEAFYNQAKCSLNRVKAAYPDYLQFQAGRSSSHLTKHHVATHFQKPAILPDLWPHG